MKQVLVLFLILFSAEGWSWDAEPIGKVKRFEVHGPTSSRRNVIVELEGVSRMCSLASNYSTAYVNKADTPNTYEVFISTLLAAKTTGSQVQIYTELGPEGCRIGRVDLR